MQPEEIFPRIEDRDGGQERGPDDCRIRRCPAGRASMAAVLELTMGLCSRRFFSCDLSPPRFAHSEPKIAPAHWTEFAVAAVVWTALLTAVAVFDAWKYFLWLHLIPAWLARTCKAFASMWNTSVSPARR